MKIVVCNYRYFVTGGPERYMFSLFELLKNNGHQPIPFSVAYNNNRETPYRRYFVSSPGDPDQVYFNELHLSPFRKLRSAMNVVYSFEARQKLEWLLRDERPDIVQTLHIPTVLSFSLIDAAKSRGLPVVSRLSNYHLLCPTEHFLRDNRVCEECKKSLFNAIKYKCARNSVSLSGLRVLSLWFHRWKRTYDKIDSFIVPSHFLRSKLIEYGFPESKVDYLPSFVNISEFKPSFKFEDYIVYSGRIAVEKGVPDLIKAFSRVAANVKLVIVGNDRNPEGDKVKRCVEGCDLSNIKFLGYQPLPRLKKILQNALFTVCPSIWYENSPMSTYESFALGKPVLGSRIGSINEQVIEGRTGLLFEPGNIDDLADKMNYLIHHRPKLVDMGKEARKIVEQEHSPEVHYDKLMAVYDKLIQQYK